MSDNVIELERSVKSKEVAFIARGCKISFKPPEGKELTINELAEIFDTAKMMVIQAMSFCSAEIEGE